MHIINDITPKFHETYLFFLRYDSALKGFEYWKLWLSENGIMKPLFPDDVSLGANSQYAGKALSGVAQALRLQLGQDETGK